MVSQRQSAKSNESINIDGQRTLISGGTQGIGAGLALRFALGGSSIWLIGRNQSKADDLIAQLKLASAEAQRRRQANGYPTENGSNSKGKEVDHQFFKADLSNVDEMNKVVEQIAKQAGEKGIDWLIETQGGPPSGTWKEPTNSKSPESAFAVQCLSRFALASQLTSKGILKRGVVMIGAPGGGGKGPLDTEDLDLSKAREQGKWKPGLFGLMKSGARDSAVLDSVTQTLSERHPNLLFSHLFPGYVSTESPANVGFPFPLPQLASIFGPYIGSKPGVGGYAEVPFYLTSHPDGNRYLRAGEANLLNQNLKRVDLSPCVDDRLTREKVWEGLESWLK